MHYPDGKTYRQLYAKYMPEHGRPVSELIDYAGDLKGKKVLDLCAGTGELGIECANRGASTVYLVDNDRKMLAEAEAQMQEGMCTVVADVNDFLISFAGDWRFDVVFCRQGVNYWLDEMNAGWLANIIKPGGVFIFNTFNREPDTVPMVKRYNDSELGGYFAEVSYLVGDTVYHVQAKDGCEPHVTSFKWISEKQFRAMLEPNFRISGERKGGTDIYVCSRTE